MNFPNLHVLNLSRTNVSDTVTQSLSKLQKLAYVDLTGTSVTGKGLFKMLDCPLLHILRAINKILTASVRAELKSKSPHLHIYGEDFVGDRSDFER